MATIRPYDPADLGRVLALWDGQVDVDDALQVISTANGVALVAASELFTPADIEFAARKAAQRAFEREHFGGAAHRARTEDFLACIAETRPSLSEEIVAGFAADVRGFARG